MNWVIMLKQRFALILVLFGFLACEEDFGEFQPTQQIKAPVQATKARQYVLDIETPGEESKEIADWIINPELSLMRRYVVDAPNAVFNGNSMRIRSVFFEFQSGQWKLILSDTPLVNDLDIIPRGNRIELPLGGAPASEYYETQALGKSQAELRIQKSTGKSYAWHALSNHLLEIQEWNVGLFDANKATVQKAGTASGRFQIYFKDSKGIEGWASGKFDQAMIRYVGDPSVTTKPSL
jgi:hypothetical protein